ncbi:MAG: nucleoside hydrolase, partial [Sulfobacillus sp.]|nr:nucleoside hydrolase [Sulfobacillus sp.]
MVQKPPVWLDMDPGIDDAWAMALALAACDVRGISAVAGNVSLPHTFANAQKILRTLSGDDRPVLPGAIGPL